MKPIDLSEDRSPEQLAADGDAEPVPCGPFASVTHCCEYHAVHSDDDFAAARSDLAGALTTLGAIRGYMHSTLADGSFALKGPTAQRIRDLLNAAKPERKG